MNLRTHTLFGRPRRRFGRSVSSLPNLLVFLGILGVAGTAGATDSLEPNDDHQLARRLTSGQAVQSYLSNGFDQDWFVFATGQGGSFSATLSSVPGDADYVLSVYTLDANGAPELAAEADAGGNGGDETISGTLNGAGVFYVVVTPFAFGFNATDSYSLTASFPGGWPGGANDAFEPNDDPTQAILLSSGQTLTPKISAPGDLDWFGFQTTQTGDLSLAVTSIPATADFDLRLFEVGQGGGLELLDDSVNEPGQNELIALSGVPAGTYYLVVYGWSGSFDGNDGYELLATLPGGGGGGNQPPTITLNAPNGGESWQVGSQHAITWTASDPNAGDALSISLEYSVNAGGSWTAISSGLANSGSFNWTVPNAPTGQARVRATVSDGQATAQDQSNANFIIVAQPSGQNTLAVASGSGQNGTQVAVALSLDNDDAVKGLQTDISFDPAVVTFVGAQGASRGASMTVSAAVIGGNKVRVVMYYATAETITAGQGTIANLTWSLVGAGGTSSALTPGATILSDPNGTALTVSTQAGTLSVSGGGGGASPQVVLSAPNGGENWQVGSQHAITYVATDADTPSNQLTIRYEYSTNAGGAWTQIADTQANSGSFNWTVPNAPSSQARVRVTASDGVRTGSDESAANFTIASAPGGTNTLAIGSGSGTSGGEATIALSLDNDDAIKALQTDIDFDPAVASYVAANLAPRATGMQISASLIDTNTLRVVMHYENTSNLAAGTGAIAEITFSLLAAGQSALTLSGSVLSDPSGNAVVVAEQDGSLTVTGGGGGQSPTVSVVNPNGGEVLTAGATATINWTATDPDTPSGNLIVTIQYSTTGVNGTYLAVASGETNDGAFAWTVPNTPATTCRVKVTVSDGQNSANDTSNADFTIQPGGVTANTLSLGSGVGGSGTQVTIPVSLDNDDIVKALQFDVSFDAEVVSFASVSGAARGAAMNATGRTQSSGRARVVLDFRNASTLAAGNGQIASLTFNLIGASGTSSTLLVSSLLLSDPDASELDSDGVSGSISVEGGGGNSPTLRMFALKNPGRERTLQIFLSSDQALSANPTVTAGGAGVTMTLVDPSENLYGGTVAVASGAGSVTISAQGQSAGGTGNTSVTVNF